MRGCFLLGKSARGDGGTASGDASLQIGAAGLGGLEGFAGDGEGAVGGFE